MTEEIVKLIDDYYRAIDKFRVLKNFEDDELKSLKNEAYELKRKAFRKILFIEYKLISLS